MARPVFPSDALEHAGFRYEHLDGGRGTYTARSGAFVIRVTMRAEQTLASLHLGLACGPQAARRSGGIHWRRWSIPLAPDAWPVVAEAVNFLRKVDY
jgi:hypothetical protein